MSKRRPKNGYCITCGDPLKRPSAFDQSCTIRCAANAWYALQGAGGRYGLDNEHCELCGKTALECAANAACSWEEEE